MCKKEKVETNLLFQHDHLVKSSLTSPPPATRFSNPIPISALRPEPVNLSIHLDGTCASSFYFTRKRKAKHIYLLSHSKNERKQETNLFLTEDHHKNLHFSTFSSAKKSIFSFCLHFFTEIFFVGTSNSTGCVSVMCTGLM